MPLLASFDLLAVHERSIRTVRHGAPCARCNQECQDEENVSFKNPMLVHVPFYIFFAKTKADIIISAW